MAAKANVFRAIIALVILSPCTAYALQDEQEQDQQDKIEFTAEQLEFFENKVRPILVNRCYECHEGKHAEGGLNLESRKAILNGGDTGPGIVVKDPEESLIIDAVNYGDFYEMPPDSKLPQEEIDILTKWVNEGAPWPSHSDVEIETGDDFDIAQRKADHWCWQTVVRPEVPIVEGNWATDPLDHFVQKKVNEVGLNVAARADRATRLRRVSYDLIGLPPTKEHIQAFVVDQSMEYSEVVDELLASPHFGERWARHWMDLTRYAETCGHEFDYPIPHAYQYRDYLIRAFNADVPYDQFVREHLAGDLITTPRRHPTLNFNESILGTGFWFLGEATHGPVDVKGDEAGHIDNQIDVMCKTFQGLTVACARCHDHKFDAISTKDYYALSGFLQSSRRQEAMLDHGSRIEQAYQRLLPLDRQSNRLVDQWKERLGAGDANQLASYLQAAIQIERTNPRWFAREEIVLQGETLKTTQSDSGIVEVQEIKPQGKFSWQENKQTWWRDAAKEGDQWALEFAVPKSGQYAISASFTVAPDYGAASITIDDHTVVARSDFYAASLGTRMISLGQVKLEAGTHKIRFKLLTPHKDAIKRNMVGLDFISCQRIEERAESTPPLNVADIARQQGLDEAVLSRLVESLQSPAIQSVGHPLHAVSQLIDGNSPLDPARFQQLAAELTKQTQRASSSRNSSVKFADFETAEHGWFTTGYGFNGGTSTASFASGKSNDLVPRGVLNSDRFGGNFFGVVRSPTFVITHPNIHIRLKSQNARIRLIIDGYVMDEYNALLFNDVTVKDANHSQFQWRTQSGDIKKYIGHRAHLEVIDHNNGFAAIDEVWFSDGAGPSEQPSPLLLPSLNQPGLAKFCNNTAEQILQTLQGDQVERRHDQAQLLTWILQHQLSPSISTGSESNVSTGDVATTATMLADQILQIRNDVQDIAGQVPHPTLAVAMADGTGENEFVFVRGNHKMLGETADRQFLEALVGDDSDRFAEIPGSGRMQIVDQILSPKNPLTSRVMVNRIWHHLTGRGIVRSVDNFGVLGAKPSNQELLDYLSDEFVNDGWSVKRMIRRIVLSSTYQMSSTPNPAAIEIDPNNELMHRARIRRLQGEVIRDSILTTTGELDSDLFGPSVSIHLTPFMQGRGRPGKSGPLDGNRRRSIYIEVRRNFLSPMMLAFDTPIPFNATGRRNLSNVPAQALILMNDPFVLEQARKWSQKLTQQHKSFEDRIQSVYLSAFGRQPTQDESETAQAFLKVQAQELGVDSQSAEAWQDFCHVIFNVKEFIHIK